MKTLVYCTGFSLDERGWLGRYRPWLDRILNSPLQVDQILIVDDGSPVLPKWRDLPVVTAKPRQAPAKVHCNSKAFLYHFNNRLGRPELLNFPGWYRSFAFGALYGASHGFERIIHLESDAVLLSAGLHAYINNFSQGWATLWCQRYQCPEIAIQVAAGSGIKELAAFASRPYAEIEGQQFESVLPIPIQELRFRGGRFSETEDQVARDHDFATQVAWQRNNDYHWWRPPVAAERQLVLTFNQNGNTHTLVGQGWSNLEPRFRWMIDAHSRLRLPIFSPGSDCVVTIAVNPYVPPGVRKIQRLQILLHDQTIANFELTRLETVTFEIPGDLRRGDGTDWLEFLHPDGISPLDATGIGPTRVMSVAVESLTLTALN